MKITVMTPYEQLIMIDVEADEQVESVKAILEVETQTPLSRQQLHYYGKPLDNSLRLNAAGVRDGDLLTMSVAQSPPTSRQEERAGGPMYNPDGSVSNPSAFIREIKSNSEMMGHLRQSNPPLARAIADENVEELQGMLRAIHRQLKEREREEAALLSADPLDVEAQRRIEEAIRQKNVDENYETAMEYSPEVFTRVSMLYVDMEVNNIPIKAFVDSGAQMTNMSLDCAERCGLMRLIDRRFQGIARGVGTSKIIGRIHAVQLKIGQNYYMCSITVLDSLGNDFLFGLDMLRKHMCCIDLENNLLHVGRGEIKVPFLAERDIPVHAEMEESSREDVGKEAGPASSSAPSTSAPQGAAVSQAPGSSSVPGTSGEQKPTAPEEVAWPMLNNELKVIRLMELGFSHSAVVEALRQCNGNEEQAAGLLFGG